MDDLEGGFYDILLTEVPGLPRRHPQFPRSSPTWSWQPLSPCLWLGDLVTLPSQHTVSHTRMKQMICLQPEAYLVCLFSSWNASIFNITLCHLLCSLFLQLRSRLQQDACFWSPSQTFFSVCSKGQIRALPLFLRRRSHLFLYHRHYLPSNFSPRDI